ncbi:Rv0361 family membrane protein [Micromonospora sp. NPDC003197]
MAYQQPPPPPPASKSGNTTRIVLIVVAVVLVLCCLGAGLFGYVFYRTVQDATGPARDATTGYLDDLRERDYPGAYGRLCTQVRADMTAEEFARRQSAQPTITSYKIVGLNVTNNNGRVTGTTTVRLTQEPGATSTQVFPLVKEDGQWRICQ